MGGMGLIFTHVLVRRLLYLDPPGLSSPITSISWTHSYVLQTVLLESTYNLPPDSHPSHHSPHPPPSWPPPCTCNL